MTDRTFYSSVIFCTNASERADCLETDSPSPFKPLHLHHNDNRKPLRTTTDHLGPFSDRRRARAGRSRSTSSEGLWKPGKAARHLPVITINRHSPANNETVAPPCRVPQAYVVCRTTRDSLPADACVTEVRDGSPWYLSSMVSSHNHKYTLKKEEEKKKGSVECINIYVRLCPQKSYRKQRGRQTPQSRPLV